jgi:hypothetical protein
MRVRTRSNGCTALMMGGLFVLVASTPEAASAQLSLGPVPGGSPGSIGSIGWDLRPAVDTPLPVPQERPVLRKRPTEAPPPAPRRAPEPSPPSTGNRPPAEPGPAVPSGSPRPPGPGGTADPSPPRGGQR